MASSDSAIQVQDDNTEVFVSIVECKDTPEINGIVVLNSDGSSIW